MSEVLDYEKIFLTSREMEIFLRLKTGVVLSLHPVDAARLVELGLVSRYALSSADDEYVVTNEGLRYAEYLEQNKPQPVPDKVSEVHAEHRFQILLVLLTVAATLLLEHFPYIAHLLKNFFSEVFG